MPKREEVLQEVEGLLKNYCEGCLLHRIHVQEKDRRHAHRFCISQCTVGEQIKTVGSKLNK